MRNTNLRLYRHGPDVWAQTATPVRVRRHGVVHRGTLTSVARLHPDQVAHLAGVTLGDSATDRAAEAVKAWGAKVAGKIREMLTRALRSPISALVAGLALFVPGWGPGVVKLYLGARAGMWLADSPGEARELSAKDNVRAVKDSPSITRGPIR